MAAEVGVEVLDGACAAARRALGRRGQRGVGEIEQRAVAVRENGELMPPWPSPSAWVQLPELRRLCRMPPSRRIS